MSVNILHRTIAAASDGKLVLSNGQWAAELGSSWNVLRLGWRWAITDSGIGIYGFSFENRPEWYVGMLASPDAQMTNGPLGNLTSHFVGIYNVASGSFPAMARSTGPLRYSHTVSVGKKVGATVTDGDNMAAGSLLSADVENVRTAMILQITKGSPSFSFEAVGVNSGSTTGLVDCSLDILKEAMAITPFSDADEFIESELGISSLAYIWTNGGTLAVDEGTDGTLTHVCAAWERTSNDLEFSEMLFKVMS
jgi:hypothetical protein